MGAVDTTYTFTATDTITSTKMNNIIDQTTMTGDAIIGTTLEVASGKLKVRAAGITSNELAANSVTTNAITDLNVTTGKIADLSVTTAKIADSNVTPAKLSQKITLGSLQTPTSGTSVDFTGIPSWASRITLMFNGVSTNGTSQLLVQIGDAGGIETTGYQSAAAFDGTAQGFSSSTQGFLIEPPYNVNASSQRFGSMIISTLGSNIWVAQLGMYQTTIGISVHGGGGKTLSDTLTQLRLTTVGGVNTFDSGSINIIYE